MVELKAIGHAWLGDRLTDGDGLIGTVRTSDDDAVTIHWRYAYKRAGRVAWHYCGTWPMVSLEAIRSARDAARDAIKRGADPNEKRQADRIEERERVRATIAADQQRRAEDATLEELAWDWFKNGVLRKVGNAALCRAFHKDVFPRIGSKPVRMTTEQDLRDALIAIIERGSNRVAVRLWCDLLHLFAWAEKPQPWCRMLVDIQAAERERRGQRLGTAHSRLHHQIIAQHVVVALVGPTQAQPVDALRQEDMHAVLDAGAAAVIAQRKAAPHGSDRAVHRLA